MGLSIPVRRRCLAQWLGSGISRVSSVTPRLMLTHGSQRLSAAASSSGRLAAALEETFVVVAVHGAVATGPQRADHHRVGPLVHQRPGSARSSGSTGSTGSTGTARSAGSTHVRNRLVQNLPVPPFRPPRCGTRCCGYLLHFIESRDPSLPHCLRNLLVRTDIALPPSALRTPRRCCIPGATSSSPKLPTRLLLTPEGDVCCNAAPAVSEEMLSISPARGSTPADCLS